MHSQGREGEMKSDPLQEAVRRLLGAVPEFSVSGDITGGHIDTENPYMVFEGFARFLLKCLRETRSEPAVKKGFDFINDLLTSTRGAAADLAVVTVLERLAEDNSVRALAEASLEGEARSAFLSLVDDQQ
jgi:hypothetical protein